MLPTLFRIGPVTLHTYGLLVAVGFLVAMSVLRRTIGRSGLPAGAVDSLSIWMLVSGIVGARVLFFAVDGFAGLRGDPMAFFRIWEGGLAFYGGVLGAFLAAMVFARRHGVRLLAVTDALVPPLFIGHAIGRLGCLAAGCCYGKPAGNWPGIVFHHPDSLAPQNVALIPTQILEALALGGLFVWSYRLFRRNPAEGKLFAFYLVGYAVVRFLMEFLRGDDRGHMVAGLSPSQAIAILLLSAGAGLFFYAKRNASS